MSLLSPSGGLIYHLRARRYAGSTWQTFRTHIAAWLRERLPQSGEELVLVGPSAGHCLPIEQIAAFRRLVLLEPDPLARLLLTRKIRPIRPDIIISAEPRDLLVGPLLRGAGGLDSWLAERPESAVLFCNVLGQLHLGVDERQHGAWCEAFRLRVYPQLAQRPWASFHDRWSLDGPEPLLTSSASFASRPEDDELARSLFGEEGPALTVLDHGVDGLFPDHLPRHYFAWPLTPEALHVVEALPAR
jgi:hypothetical protein